MTTPGPDWVEQARRFAAGLATEHPGLTDALGGLLGAARGGDPAAQDPAQRDGAEHVAECRSCPLCVALAALRGRRPDLLEALADVLTGAATALRTTAGATAAADQTAAETPPEETAPGPAPVPTVQRIDVA